MTETTNMQEQTIPQQEQPVALKYHPEAKIILSLDEFEILCSTIRAFEMPLAIYHMKRDQLAAEKNLVPVFKEDCQTNEQGQILAVGNQPLLKNEKEFWEKFQPKQDKTIIVPPNLN